MPLNSLHMNYLCGSYQDDLRHILKIAENNSLRLNPQDPSGLKPHYDKTANPPSIAIGYGYDLVKNRTVAVRELRLAGITVSQEAERQILALSSGTVSQATADALALVLALPNETVATALLDAAIAKRNTAFLAFLNSVSGLGESRERAVLESMWYQGQGKYLSAGNDIAKALAEGNRAEVWYQIRYKSAKMGEESLLGAMQSRHILGSMRLMERHAILRREISIRCSRSTVQIC